MFKESRPLVFTLLYLIYGLDLLGVVVVFVIFSPLIVDSDAILSAKTALETRNVILGFLLATYPLATFFGAPLLGEISDRIGRRPVLIVTAYLTAIAFAVTALAIAIRSLVLLFIGRLAAGLFAGNVTVTQAAVANRTTARERPQYMALFAVSGGISWVIGPYIGQLLSDSELVSWFDAATPFWLLAICFALLGMVVTLAMKAIEKARMERLLHLGQAYASLAEVLRPSPFFHALLASIFGLFGWMMYQAFLAAYLIERFDFSQAEEAWAYINSSVWWLIAGVLGNQWLLKRYAPQRVNLIPVMVAGFSILSFLFFTVSAGVWIATAFANFAMGLTLSCYFSIFGQLAPPDMQGRVFGTWSAGLALAMAVGPAVAGWLTSYWINLSTLLAGIILILAAFYYYWWYWRSKRHHFSRQS